jgi:hypothetical protein
MNHGLTIEQAAEQSGLSIASIYNLIKAGKLVALRQDGQTLVSKASLESVLSAVCPVCGEPFRKGNQRQRFCSQACRQKANRTH